MMTVLLVVFIFLTVVIVDQWLVSPNPRSKAKRGAKVIDMQAKRRGKLKDS
jgi:hypothetical protein